MSLLEKSNRYKWYDLPSPLDCNTFSDDFENQIVEVFENMSARQLHRLFRIIARNIVRQRKRIEKAAKRKGVLK